MKNRSHYISILRWSIMLAAYGYLAYRLYTFQQYEEVKRSLLDAQAGQYICLVLGLMLFPVNQWAEALKWQRLTRQIEPMSIREAQRQIYYGMVGGFFTPYRIGDFPARVLLMKNKQNWLSAIGLALVGSFTLTLVIELVGIVPLLCYAGKAVLPIGWIIGAMMVCIGLIGLAPWGFRWCAKRTWKSEKIQDLVQRLAKMDYRELMILIGLSLLRYGCFAVQLYLVMRYVGIEMGIKEALLMIPTYYLLVTITPSIPVAEIGIRGSWAAILWGGMKEEWTASAVLAIAILWCINQVLPLIVGSLVKKESKKDIH